jgi:hypothetical protein
MCGMMLTDQLFGTLNPTIGHSIEKFAGNSSKKTVEHNLYHHNPTKGRFAIYTSFVEAFATHLACLVQEILRKGSLMPIPQPPRIDDVVEN